MSSVNLQLLKKFIFDVYFKQKIKVSFFHYRQIALKALSERLSKDHAKPWQQDKTKKHSPAPVILPMPETDTPKTTANPNISQVSVDIHSPPSSNT